MQTRLTNSFITSAGLISAQTLPRARRETGLPPLRGRAAGTRGAHAWGARTAASSWIPAGKLGTQSWDRQGCPRGHWAHWNPGDVSELCAHRRAVPGAHHVPDWPGAGLCCPALASDPAGFLPGWAWHQHPAALALALSWHHRGGCVGREGGCICRCPDAPGEHWSHRGQLGSARRCCLAGGLQGSTGSSRLRASLSQQDGAQLKASDKLFDGGELCQLPSSVSCQRAKCQRQGPLCVGQQAGLAPLGTAGHPLPSP